MYADDKAWDIELRYSNLSDFNTQLMKSYKGIGNLGLPNKTFFNNSKLVKESRKDGI